MVANNNSGRNTQAESGERGQSAVLDRRDPDEAGVPAAGSQVIRPSVADSSAQAAPDRAAVPVVQKRLNRPAAVRTGVGLALAALLVAGTLHQVGFPAQATTASVPAPAAPAVATQPAVVTMPIPSTNLPALAVPSDCLPPAFAIIYEAGMDAVCGQPAAVAPPAKSADSSCLQSSSETLYDGGWVNACDGPIAGRFAPSGGASAPCALALNISIYDEGGWITRCD